MAELAAESAHPYRRHIPQLQVCQVMLDRLRESGRCRVRFGLRATPQSIRDYAICPAPRRLRRSANTASSTMVLHINGDLTGRPQFTSFDSGVAGPSIPVVDDYGALWFGNGSARPMVVRIDGDLATTPTITPINTNTPSAGFPIVDDLGDIWFGTTDPAGSSNLLRLS